MDIQDEYVQYFVVNKELNMSTGKVGAQIGHVATICTYEMCNPLSEYAIYHGNFILWFKGESQTKIVLQGKQKDLEKLIEQGFFYVKDNGLTEIPPGSLTVVGLPPMLKSEAQQYVKRLQLYRD